MTRRRRLQLVGTALAGVALAAGLMIGLHRPGSRMWETAASFTLTLVSQLRGEGAPVDAPEFAGLMRDVSR